MSETVLREPTIEELVDRHADACEAYLKWEPEVGADNEASYAKVNSELTAARQSLIDAYKKLEREIGELREQSIKDREQAYRDGKAFELSRLRSRVLTVEEARLILGMVVRPPNEYPAGILALAALSRIADRGTGK